MIYGVLMILVVYFLPDGIVPAVRRWWQGRADATMDATTEPPAAEAAR
jgi:branched-chain amino acid transport system permease protein